MRKKELPAGTDFTAQEWRLLQRELEPLDPLLREFARRVGGDLTRDYHGYPNRTIRWTQGLVRSVDLYLSDREKRLFGVGAIAYKDKTVDGQVKRRIRSTSIRAHMTGQELRSSLIRLLEQARATAVGWTEDDLE